MIQYGGPLIMICTCVICTCLIEIFEEQLMKYTFQIQLILCVICMIIYWILCLGTNTVYMSYKTEDDDELKYIYLYKIGE